MRAEKVFLKVIVKSVIDKFISVTSSATAQVIFQFK